jgi:hypothetical protein
MKMGVALDHDKVVGPDTRFKQCVGNGASAAAKLDAMALASCVLLGVTEATLSGDFSHLEKNTNSAFLFIFYISAFELNI